MTSPALPAGLSPDDAWWASLQALLQRTLGVPDPHAGAALLHTLFGEDRPSWSVLQALEATDLAEAFRHLKWTLPLQRPRQITALLAAAGPQTAVCDTCGEVGMQLRGGQVQADGAPGSACAHCDTGHLTLRRWQAGRWAWTHGRVVPLDQTHDRVTWPGEVMPLTDEGLRQWVGSSLHPSVEAVCDQAGVPLQVWLGWRCRQAPALRSAADVWAALVDPGPLEEDAALPLRLQRMHAHGEARAHWPPPPPPREAPARADLEDWVLVRPLGEGAWAQVWEARSTGLWPRRAVVKLARTAQGEAALDHELSILRTLQQSGQPGLSLGPMRAPVPIGAGRWPREGLPDAARRSGEEQEVFACIHTHGPGYVETLAQTRHRLGDALPARASVWMAKRMLETLATAHRLGVMHGAVIPRHVLVHSRLHSLRLVGWSHARRLRSAAPMPLQAWLEGWQDLYPVPARTGAPVLPALDPIMALRTLCWVVGGDAGGAGLRGRLPDRLARWFQAHAALDPRQPVDAAGWLRELDQLDRDVFGLPAWVPIPV
jgi:hypothetical protein